MKRFIFLFVINFLSSISSAGQIAEYDYKDLAGSSDLYAWQYSKFHNFKDNNYLFHVVPYEEGGVKKLKLITNLFNKEKLIATYKKVLDDIDPMSHQSIKIASDNNIIYARLNTPWFNTKKSYWLNSTDAKNWQEVNNIPNIDRISKMYGSNNLLIFINLDRLFFSYDSGNKWHLSDYSLDLPLFVENKIYDKSIPWQTPRVIEFVSKDDVRSVPINIPYETTISQNGRQYQLKYGHNNKIYGNNGKYLLSASYYEYDYSQLGQYCNKLLFSNGGYNWKFIDINLKLNIVDYHSNSLSTLQNFYSFNSKYYLIVEKMKFTSLDNTSDEWKAADLLLRDIHDHSVEVYELTEEQLLTDNTLNLTPKYIFDGTKYMNIADNMLVLGKSNPMSIKVQFHDLN